MNRDRPATDPWPLNSFLKAHPRIALALLAVILILQMGVDGLLAGSN